MDDPPLPMIHQAAIALDGIRVREILSKGSINANAWDHTFRTPLHAVFQSLQYSVQEIKARSVVKLLLEYGTDVDASWGEKKITPLFQAIHLYQMEIIELLLFYGADPNKCECFYWAVYKYKKKKLVKLLLKYRADPKNLFKKHYYEQAKHSKTFSILLDLGDKIHYIYDMIKAAVRNNNGKAIKYILKQSDHFNPNGRFSLSELMSYIDLNPRKEYFNEMKHTLRKMGYNKIRKPIYINNTPLHSFIADGDYCSAKALLNTGKFVNATNEKGDTPFHFLIRNYQSEMSAEFYEMIRLFLKHGAEINIRNCFNQTPFSLAVVYGYPKAIAIMLANITGFEESKFNNIEHRIREDCEDIHYNVPIEINSFELYIAMYLNYDEVVDRLINIGCKKENSFYINYAIMNRRYKIAKILYEAGFPGFQEEYPFAIQDYVDDELVKKENLKLLSLVWTFNEDSILKVPLTHILMWSQILTNSRELEIFILFFALKLQLDEFGLAYRQITDWQFSEFNPFPVVDQLKENKLCKNNSMYDIFMMNFDSLVNFLNDPDNFDDCLNLCKIIQDKPDNEIKCYEIVLFEKISLAIERRRRDHANKEVRNSSGPI